MTEPIQTTHIPISKLTLYENNPRKIDKQQFEKLCANIQRDPDFFNNRPCLVNRVGDKQTVYAGNQRVRAAKKLGWKEVPCIVENNLDEQIVKDRMILDNKSFGEFDFDILASDFEPGKLLELGFSESDLGGWKDPEKNQEAEDDLKVLEPGKDEDALTKLGDIYELNNHRLVCGDSTSSEYVNKCLNGNTPVLMVTDPPYGVEYDPSWREIAGKGCKAKGKVQNDGRVDWSSAWKLFPGSVAYVWSGDKYAYDSVKSLINVEYLMINQIIWVKQHFALSRGDYHSQHESCWYAVKKGQKHNWQGARDQSTTWEISNLNGYGKSQKEGEERTAHSTQKPIECMARPIRNNTAKGEGVYDPFLGSGTTLIAAEQFERICYGIELSPAYCDIIVERWKNWMIKKGNKYVIKRNGEVID